MTVVYCLALELGDSLASALAASRNALRPSKWSCYTATCFTAQPIGRCASFEQREARAPRFATDLDSGSRSHRIPNPLAGGRKAAESPQFTPQGGHGTWPTAAGEVR